MAINQAFRKYCNRVSVQKAFPNIDFSHLHFAEEAQLFAKEGLEIDSTETRDELKEILKFVKKLENLRGLFNQRLKVLDEGDQAQN